MFFNKLRLGNAYACTAGDHVGKTLIYIEKVNENYGFLAIPTMENLYVPSEQFEFGIKTSIIEKIERVPKYVRKVAAFKFRENKENIQPTG